MATLVRFIHPVWGLDTNDGLARTPAGGGVGPWKTLAKAVAEIAADTLGTDDYKVVLMQGSLQGADIMNLEYMNPFPELRWTWIVGEGRAILDGLGALTDANPVIPPHTILEGLYIKGLRGAAYGLAINGTIPVVIKKCRIEFHDNCYGSVGVFKCSDYIIADAPGSPLRPDTGELAQGLEINRTSMILGRVDTADRMAALYLGAGTHRVYHSLFYGGWNTINLRCNGGQLYFRGNVVAFANDLGGIYGIDTLAGQCAGIKISNCGFWKNKKLGGRQPYNTTLFNVPDNELSGLIIADENTPDPSTDPVFLDETNKVFYLGPLTAYAGAAHDGRCIGPYGYGPWAHCNQAGIGPVANWGNEDYIHDPIPGAWLADPIGGVIQDPTTLAWTLQGVTDGTLTSPVYDFTELRYVRNILFDFNDDEALDAGDRHIIDFDGDVTRKIEYRYSNTAFDQDTLDITLPWSEAVWGGIVNTGTDEYGDINVTCQYFQVRFVLKING